MTKAVRATAIAAAVSAAVDRSADGSALWHPPQQSRRLMSSFPGAAFVQPANGRGFKQFRFSVSGFFFLGFFFFLGVFGALFTATHLLFSCTTGALFLWCPSPSSFPLFSFPSVFFCFFLLATAHRYECIALYARQVNAHHHDRALHHPTHEPIVPYPSDGHRPVRLHRAKCLCG